MMHKDRTWRITKIDSAGELAEELTEYIGCLCNGFELDGYWFLNDSTSENGAQEYAIVRKPSDDRPALQVESITMGWCTYHEALNFIEEAIDGTYDKSDYAHEVKPKIDRSEKHRCYHCA